MTYDGSLTQRLSLRDAEMILIDMTICGMRSFREPEISKSPQQPAKSIHLLCLFSLLREILQHLRHPPA